MCQFVYRHLADLSTDDVTDLDLNFAVFAETASGSTNTIELLPGGENMDVTNENKLRFVLK